MPTYSESMKRLDAIIQQMENGSTDIDTLAAQLKEAKELLAFCKKKLTQIDAEVKKILSDEPEM